MPTTFHHSKETVNFDFTREDSIKRHDTYKKSYAYIKVNDGTCISTCYGGYFTGNAFLLTMTDQSWNLFFAEQNSKSKPAPSLPTTTTQKYSTTGVLNRRRALYVPINSLSLSLSLSFSLAQLSNLVPAQSRVGVKVSYTSFVRRLQIDLNYYSNLSTFITLRWTFTLCFSIFTHLHDVLQSKLTKICSLTYDWGTNWVVWCVR